MMSVCVGCNSMMENGAINYKGYEAKWGKIMSIMQNKKKR